MKCRNGNGVVSILPLSREGTLADHVDIEEPDPETPG